MTPQTKAKKGKRPAPAPAPAPGPEAAAEPAPNRGLENVEWWPLSKIRPYQRNPRKNADAIPKVAESLRIYGWRQPIVVDRDGVIVAGDTRYRGAKLNGWDKAPVHQALDLTPEQAKAYRIADNRTGEEAEWDLPLLRTELLDLQGSGLALESLGFNREELGPLLQPEGGLRAGADPDAIPDAPKAKDAITRPGDVITLGRHRLVCGDATKPDDLAKLLDGVVPDTIVTDPPYCSGGFQEAGRAKGSIGTGARIKPRIANDTLSTRGWRQLLKATAFGSEAPTVYVFLDWRMWANLFDLAEESGYGVRQMIVWDKGTPGMGRGWRSQHELVLFGTRAVVDFDNRKAVGNVRSPKRTGNKHHPTEKPVEIITDILAVMDMAATVYDPFAGSGTTLIAAEMLGRQCFAMELKPAFCDVIVERWEQVTGGKAGRPR